MRADSANFAIAGFCTSLAGLVTCGLASPVALCISLMGIRSRKAGFAICGTAISLIGMLPLFFFVSSALRPVVRDAQQRQRDAETTADDVETKTPAPETDTPKSEKKTSEPETGDDIRTQYADKVDYYQQSIIDPQDSETARLAHETGFQWSLLNDQQKNSVCELIAERTGRHDAATYRQFIDSVFRGDDYVGDREIFKQRVSLTAAHAAASDLGTEKRLSRSTNPDTLTE